MDTKMDTKMDTTIINALRCSAAPWRKGATCNDCPYRLLDPMEDELKYADVVIDGVGYYESCDVDKIALDAADALERRGAHD